MTNWHDPTLEAAETVAHVKLLHVIWGSFIWDFVLSLEYEYSIITRTRKFSCGSLLYMGCRWCTLLVVILGFLERDMSHEVNCQAVITQGLIFIASSLLFASGLVILRINVLWERNKIVIVIASTVCLVNAAFYTYSISTLRGHYAATSGVCAIDDTLHTRFIIFSTFITDLVLLGLMLSGVLRWKEARRRGGVWWLLLKQGLVWTVIFTLVEVPPVVFIILNLNDPMNLAFLIPGVISMTMCASRMHLGLVNSTLMNESPLNVVGDGKCALESATASSFE